MTKRKKLGHRRQPQQQLQQQQRQQPLQTTCDFDEKIDVMKKKSDSDERIDEKTGLQLEAEDATERDLADKAAAYATRAPLPGRQEKALHFFIGDDSDEADDSGGAADLESKCTYKECYVMNGKLVFGQLVRPRGSAVGRVLGKQVLGSSTDSQDGTQECDSVNSTVALDFSANTSRKAVECASAGDKQVRGHSSGSQDYFKDDSMNGKQVLGFSSGFPDYFKDDSANGTQVLDFSSGSSDYFKDDSMNGKQALGFSSDLHDYFKIDSANGAQALDFSSGSPDYFKDDSKNGKQALGLSSGFQDYLKDDSANGALVLDFSSGSQDFKDDSANGTHAHGFSSGSQDYFKDDSVNGQALGFSWASQDTSTLDCDKVNGKQLLGFSKASQNYS